MHFWCILHNAPCSMGLHLHQYLVFATSCISVFLVGILRSAFVCFQFCSFKAGIYQNIINKDRYTFSLSTSLAKIHTSSLSDRPSVYQNIISKDTPSVHQNIISKDRYTFSLSEHHSQRYTSSLSGIFSVSLCVWYMNVYAWFRMYGNRFLNFSSVNSIKVCLRGIKGFSWCALVNYQ